MRAFIRVSRRAFLCAVLVLKVDTIPRIRHFPWAYTRYDIRWCIFDIDGALLCLFLGENRQIAMRVKMREAPSRGEYMILPFPHWYLINGCALDGGSARTWNDDIGRRKNTACRRRYCLHRYWFCAERIGEAALPSEYGYRHTNGE